MVALAIVTAIPRADAAEAPGCTPWIAKAVGIQGQVETRRAGETRWQPVRLEQAFCGGDMIRVSERSRAAILLRPEETTLQLDQRSMITFTKLAPSGPRWLQLLKGAANFLSRTPRSLKIITPFLNAGVEGTEFLVRVNGDQTAILVFAGTVLAENRAGRVRLQSGQQAIAKVGQAPQRSLVLRPRDAVEWALYYPPIIDYRSSALTRGVPEIREALRRYRQNDVRAALAKLDQVPDHHRDARYFDLRAALLLSIGRVDEAQSDIAQALRLQRTDATAMALQSVIALAKNQKRKASRLARQSVAREPQSPVPHIALSYAQQASFDIEAALESSEQATQLAPNNGLAWARVAELELSLGRRGRALESAEKAVALHPMLGGTQTVLGFVKLAQIQLEDAQASFEKAIRLDSADPLPRLGLGLVQIRQGKLDEGTESIEIAASLDPNQSLIRSYLGKAFYEQKRDELGRTEFDIAKALDPRDPTPWFYEAITDQTTNRPVEAIRNLQKSIALNDNRAVYRSRLLLDDDRATRNTSLGRIYTDLGFHQPAVVESAKSLGLDPANHSAHRLLSDTYVGLPRFELARGSELLQSRLLQPVTSNPVRPSRGASDLTIVPGTGFADTGFNEFSPLFDRNRVRLLTSAFGGNHNTWGEETVLSALYDRIAVSLGQFHSDSEGFRPNNDLTQSRYDLFAQVAVTSWLDIQAEYRLQDRENGELRLNVFPEDPSVTRRQTVIQESGRLGLHLKLSPRSDFIVSALYGARENKNLIKVRNESVDFPLTIIESLLDESSFQLDGQYLFRADHFNLVAGGGIYQTNIDPRNLQITPGLTVFPILEFFEPFSRHQYSAYLYNYLNWPRNLLWTFGLNYDFLDERDTTLSDALHPKVGLQWNLADALQVRFAYIESLRPATIVDESLEPTQVAGFYQSFDDPLGSRSRHYGFGLDYHLSERLYAGLEISRRDVTLPVFDFGPAMYIEEESHENLYHAYLHWTPSDRWALSGEYRYDHYILDNQVDRSPGRVFHRDSATAPVTVRYFHPRGYFAAFGLNYVHQIVDLLDVSETNTEEFITFDAAIGYRLPKRLGIVSLRIVNLLDEEFLYQDDNFRTQNLILPGLQDGVADFGASSTLFPDRTVLAGITLSF